MSTTIEKMNVKIAEWMGEGYWYVGNSMSMVRFKTKEECEAEIRRCDSRLKAVYYSPSYHSDWNALMPVVERIGNTKGWSIFSVIGLLDYSYLPQDKEMDSIRNFHLAVYNYINKTEMIGVI